MTKKKAKSNPDPESDPEIPPGKCFACSKNVTADDYCYGCKSYICEPCNVGSLSVPWGGHNKEAHLKECSDDDE